MSKPIQQKPNAREASETSLLRELGGEPALDGLVGAFYFNVLHDESLARFFTHSDFERVLRHQRQFLGLALGGGSADTDAYLGPGLQSAHHELVVSQDLNHDHFDRMLATLRATLRQLGHADDLSERICVRVEALRMDVLGTQQNQTPQPPKPTQSGDST